nr:MAG: hypothetical protein [Bacteriophage sp.]
MNIKNIENIVNGIVENELKKIIETEELDFTSENLEYKQQVLITKVIREALKKIQQKSNKD